MPDQIEQYYNYLKGAGADVAPTLQSFRKTLADDKTAKQYYEYLRQNKFDAPDTYESFAGTLGIKKKVGGAPSGLTSEEQNKYNLILQKQQEFMRSGGKQPAKQDNLVLPQPIQKIKTAEQQDGRTVLQKDKDARGNKETALQIQKRIIKEQTSKPGMPAVAAPEPVVDGLNVITDPDEILGYNLRNPEKNKVQVKYEQEQQKKKETEELIEQAQADVFYNTPAGKFYYNIFKPLAKAGGAGLANLTSGTVRTAGDIIGADEITGEWADAIYDYIHPDKRWTEEKTNWMGKTPTPLQGNLFNDGKLNAAKIVPSTVETLTNMAWLFGTAAVGNAAGAGSVPSLIGASYINTQSDYREAGKQAGLKGEALDNFTTMSAGLTSLLEAFSPNKLITGGVKTQMAKEYAEYLAKGYTSKLAFKQASKQLAKEITTENIQEISQGAGDKMVRLLFDKTSEKPLFNDDLSWNGIKDELFETMVLTTFSTGALSTPGAIRNSRPSTFEKSAWYNVAQNPEQFNAFINKQVQEGKMDLPKMQVLTDNYNKYRGAVEQAKQFGFSEHQAVEAAWQIFKGRELDNEYKRIANNPVLKEAVGNEIKEEQKQTGNEVKRIGLGIPDVGGELSGGEVVQIVNHIGDKFGEPTAEMQERIGANEYRVEEIDLKNLYETDAGFKNYVENYDRKEKNKDGLIVPAIMAKDGTIEDGKSRLAQQYINGETKAKVFQPLKTNINEREEKGQEELLTGSDAMTKQQPAAAKPKQVVLPQQQEYKGRRLKVVYDGNKRVVKGKNGKVIKQDTPEAKRILRQHEDNYNYNFGQPAATEQMPENIAPEQAGRWIAENSNNPAEVAGLYLQEPGQTRFRDKKEELIAEYGIGKFTSSDFAGVDDKANITAGMAKSYFAGKSNAAVQGIDVYAKELSDHYGIEFTPQDVADFIKRFPNREFGGTDRTETAEAAAQRFEDLTGIPLTDRVAAMAAAQFAPEELVNEARQEEDAEAERPLTEDEILEINSLLQEDFENSDNLDTFTDDETGTIPETDTAADAQPGTGAAAESGGTPVQEGGEQTGAEQDEEIYEQNDDDLIGSLAAELENELNNPTELGTGGFASETKQYDAAILRTNEQSTTAFGNLSGLSASAIERSLEATGRVLWVEYSKQQGDGIAEQQPVPISYKRAADARQLGGGVLLAGDQDYSGATLQNIRQEFGTGSEQFKYELSHVLATRLLQPGNFTGKLLRSNKALSAVDIILDNNPNPDSYFLIYNSAGFIKINMAAAAKRYELLGEQAFWPYAETALQEEVIHAVSDVITSEAEWETIYNELTPDEVASIKELYDKDDLTNKQVAGEYVRMMVQEKVFGVTTELFTLRSTTGLLNTFKKLLSYLKGVFAGNPNRVSKEVIERVETAVREMNAEVKAGVGKLGEVGTGRFDDELGVDIVDGFYSSLEKRLADMKPVKIPPKQWKERLKSQEAEFTGLNAWLDSKKESVSKEEVQQFLKDNRIEIKEVRLGEKEYSTQWEKMKDGWKRKIGNRWTFVWEYPSGIYGQGPSGYQRKFNSVEEAKNHFDEDDTSASSKPTKYFQYQLPGEKSNYKEVLVTLPPAKKGQEMFRGSHFDEYNILVHLRMNTRTDADGNKLLFIEEVQSDWGQKGKKEGFDNKELEKERNTLLDERRNLEKKESENIVVKKVGNTGFVNDFQTTYKNEDLQKSINQRYKEIDDRILKINSQTGITPSAPFVTDTNAWVKLGLKVALKEAIKQGADKIAWTTGEQQNERYDLSKQVKSIEVEKVDDVPNLFFVDINMLNETKTHNLEVENGIVRQGEFVGQKLEDIVGKDVSEKILNGGTQTLTGDNLKVGGKGMKGFYGNPADGSLGIVGNVAKSLFKQEIKTSTIKTGANLETDGEVGFYELSDGEYAVEYKGEQKEFDNITDAQNYYDSITKSTSTQHSVDITPELKMAVNRGLPFEMGTGGFGSNFNNNATVKNFIQKNQKRIYDAVNQLLASGKTEAEVALELQQKMGFSPMLSYNIIANAKLAPKQATKKTSTKATQSPLHTQNVFTTADIETATPKELPPFAKARKAINKWLGKNFSIGKGLPNWIAGMREASVGSKSADVRKAVQIIDRLKKIAKQEKFDNWDAVDKVLRGEADPSTLPDAIAAPVIEMRAFIDGLSRDLVVGGLVTPSQAVTIESNLGSYMNRSYKMFEQKKWAKDIPQNVKADAIRFLAQRAYAQLYGEKYGDTDAGVDNDLKTEALKQAEREFQEIIDDVEEAYGLRTSNDKKDVGVLKQRKDIPKEIRELLGEYANPGLTFAMTVAKLTSLKASATMLVAVKNKGMGTLFFEADDKNRPASHSVQFAGEGSAVWSPLNGLYTTPEIKEAFDASEDHLNTFWKGYMRLVGAIRWGKTVLSPVTQIKNFESNVGFSIMNGHWDVRNAATAFRYMGSVVAVRDNAGKAENIVDKLTRLGLIDQGVNIGEIRKMLQDNELQRIVLEQSDKKDYNVFKKLYNYLNNVYSGSDSFFKLYGFLNEAQIWARAKFDKDYKDLSTDEMKEVDGIAAERIKNTYPTYSRVWDGAKWLSERVPLVGNFLSFQAESLRVLFNSLGYASVDLKSSDAATRKVAVKKLATGVLPYIGMRTALMYATVQLTGVGVSGLLSFLNDDDEDEKRDDLNRYVPPFMRSGDKIYVKDKEGKIVVYNLSSIDNYGAFFKVFNAMTNGSESFEKEGMASALYELLSPFVEQEMLFESIMEVQFNENSYGANIYKEGDLPGDKFIKSATYIIDKMKPSAIDFGKRLAKEPNREVAALVGMKPYEVNFDRSFYFKTKQTALALADENDDFYKRRYAINNDTKLSTQEKNKQLKALKTEIDENIKRIISGLSRDYQAALRLGANGQNLSQTVKKQKWFEGFDEDVKKAVLTGKMPKKGFMEIKAKQKSKDNKDDAD